MLLVTVESKVKVSLLCLLPVGVTASTFTPTLLVWKLAKIPSMKKTLCCWFMLLMMSCDDTCDDVGYFRKQLFFIQPRHVSLLTCSVLTAQRRATLVSVEPLFLRVSSFLLSSF